MLVDIRRNLHKVAAGAIVGLLVLAFASWGIGDYITGFSQISVASIDGKNITGQAYARARQLQEQRYRNQLGDNYQAGMLDQPMLKMALVQELINEYLRVTDAKKSGYRISPEELTRTITDIEVFQGPNGFDRQQYKDLLRRQGLSIGGFEKDLAESIVTDQVRTGLSTSSIVPPSEVAQLLKLQGQQRDVRFLLLPNDTFANQVEVDDQAIETFYDEHIDQFQTTEQVSIQFLELVLDDFAAEINIDDQILERLYSEQESEFLTPEKRRASHLLIAIPDDADDATVNAALVKITILKEQLDDGASFSELAKLNSEDLGSALKGGDLGLFGHGIMDPAFETAAFSQPLNDVSEPVRSAFGYHLIKVTEIEAKRLQPLSEVKEEISLRYRREQAESAFFTATEALQDIVYEQPDSLQPAADEFDLVIQQSELFPRSGGTGITATNEVIEQAFSNDVLQEGQNSSVINIGNSRSVVLRITEHQPAAAKPLTEVAASIREILLAQATSEAVKTRGAGLVETLAQGESVADDLTDLSVQWQDRTALSRNQPGLPAPMVAELFRMPVSESPPTYQGMALDNGDYVVFAVTKLYDESLPATDDERLQLQLNLERLRGDIAFIGYLKNLRESVDIKIYPENI